MALVGIILSAGIMSIVSAYLLFKIKESENNNSMNNALQIMFFFMVLANFIIMGSAGYESRNDCSYLLTNSTVSANVTTNEYGFICTERVTGSASWVYRLPVWLSYASAMYLVVYLLMLVVNIIKGFNKGGEYD